MDFKEVIESLTTNVKAVGGLILAISGLITLVTGLVERVRKPKPGESPKIPSGNPTPKGSASKARRKRMPKVGSRLIIIISIVVLAIGIALMVTVRYSNLIPRIYITSPTSAEAGALSVKSVNHSAKLILKGQYTGSQGTIYILSRAANDKTWYLQCMGDTGEATITTKANWLWKGQWQADEVYIGGSTSDPDLKQGDKWVVQAFIAPSKNLKCGDNLAISDPSSELHPRASSAPLNITVGEVTH